jgi:gas vesicle protein
MDMRMITCGFVAGCVMIFSSALFAADSTSKQIQMLNSQLQVQLQRLQASQEKQLQTLNKQLQAQLQDTQKKLQSQIDTLNKTTQAQMKELKKSLETQIKQVHEAVLTSGGGSSAKKK